MEILRLFLVKLKNLYIGIITALLAIGWIYESYQWAKTEPKHDVRVFGFFFYLVIGVGIGIGLWFLIKWIIGRWKEAKWETELRVQKGILKNLSKMAQPEKKLSEPSGSSRYDIAKGKKS